MVWQLPSITMAINSFLAIVYLGYAKDVPTRLLVLLAAFGVTLVSLVVLTKHRFMELARSDDLRWLQGELQKEVKDIREIKLKTEDIIKDTVNYPSVTRGWLSKPSAFKVFRALLVLNLIAIVIIAALTLGSYSTSRNQNMLSVTYVSLGQRYGWKLGEVIDVQGTLYAYLGYEIAPYGDRIAYSLRLARWQNTWVELTYFLGETDFRSSYYHSVNVTLSPYKLQIFVYSNDYLNATFNED